MGKLLKYEFIKNRVALLVSAGIYTIFELLFLVGFMINQETFTLIGTLGLVLLGAFVFIVPLVICCKTYTNELSNKVGCLVYMTPNSTYKIVGSKYLFSAIMFICFGLLVGLYGAIDAIFLSNRLDISLKEFFDTFEVIFGTFGFNLGEILFKICGALIYFVILLIVLVAMVYLAYTFSSTFLQNGKAKSFISGILFFGLYILFIYANNFLPDINYSADSIGTMLLTTLPRIGLCIAVVVASFFGSGFMLEKKINL